MTTKTQKLFTKFNLKKNKKISLAAHFRGFIDELVYRTTKLEHPGAKRKSILSSIR